MKHPVDAYFCGHTHNYSTIVYKGKDARITQIMACCVGIPMGRPRPKAWDKLREYSIRMDKDWGWVFRGVNPSKPVPLEKITKLLIPPSNLSYYWGYLEDTAPSYYL